MAVYRADGRSGEIPKVTDEVTGPDGLCFLPDYRTRYLADTASRRAIKAFDVTGTTLRNARTLVTLTIAGTNAPSGADGIRCDVEGNIWAGARLACRSSPPTARRSA